MPPRPRPRPRPVAKVAGPSSPTSEESVSKKKINDDDDDFFVHNKGRSFREVEERAAKVAAKAAAESDNESGGGSDMSGSEGTPRPNRRSRKPTAAKGSDSSSRIVKDTAAELLRDVTSEKAVVDVSSDEYGEDGPRAGPSQSESKRTRSRSRSLTPPPEFTEQERLRTRMAIQRVLGSDTTVPTTRPFPAMAEDDDMDPGEEPINSSLRHIMEMVGNSNRRRLPGDSEQMTTSSVTIRVKWIHSSVATNVSQRSWTDPLRQIADKISQEMRVLPKELVLLQNRKQVYTTITPQGLGVWDEFDLEACARVTYETLYTRSGPAPTPPPQLNEDDGDSEREESSPPSEVAADDSDEKFKIIVRAADLSVPLTVRPTTTCGKIVRAFLAIMVKQGKPALPTKKANQVRLYVDGEKQDPNAPISDCDLEDGDIVEIIGL
ncbi:hypothetical protein Clacol_010021 [Clathrus columnatus]|uniref:Rad60/SUMO-like domain-containing protein n=1 Tax=Clathrus columnatus TaxID=1419009 RepID=A0AAV5ARV5_9AGAM|nr:hypothetical protein Clacol_010021 [Clathrus columnatus]